MDHTAPQCSLFLNKQPVSFMVAALAVLKIARSPSPVGLCDLSATEPQPNMYCSFFLSSASSVTQWFNHCHCWVQLPQGSSYPILRSIQRRDGSLHWELLSCKCQKKASAPYLPELCTVTHFTRYGLNCRGLWLSPRPVKRVSGRDSGRDGTEAFLWHLQLSSSRGALPFLPCMLLFICGCL